MNYQEAIDYIHGTYKFGSKLGLENIKLLLKLLGNPQEDLKVIHVAGTNGKGSVASFTQNILTRAGYKVGLYTSPYIEEFTERIQINGQKIDRQVLAKLTNVVREKAEKMVAMGVNHPTEFEIGTGIALLYFAREQVDFLVLEVGLGGRLDATNVIDRPLISVITPIDYDHLDHLGNSLGEIAREKAGIIKANSYVLSYPQDREAMEVIEKIARENKSELIIADFNKLQIHESKLEGQRFSLEILGKSYDNLRISMAGVHQIYNCCLALTVIEILKEKYNLSINDKDIYKGIYNTRWLGRFEIIAKDPLIIIDGAHNLQGAQALATSFRTLLKNYRITLILAMLRDKDVEGVLKSLIPLVDKVIATSPNNPRAIKPKDLLKKLAVFDKEIYASDSIEDAIRLAYKVTHIGDAIVGAGSLYMIGEIRKRVKRV
mgnify:CR=1 FL=1